MHEPRSLRRTGRRHGRLFNPVSRPPHQLQGPALLRRKLAQLAALRGAEAGGAEVEA
ncbi:hypothetical protein PF003_g37232 [Phytophthora fragariae]|nr:hypothetical protein PF003_g37232 [Phytophthora fragariae]